MPSAAKRASEDPLSDDDFHLALYLCYELHYRGFEEVDDQLEWDPELIRLRIDAERTFEEALRVVVVAMPVHADVRSVQDRPHRKRTRSPPRWQAVPDFKPSTLIGSAGAPAVERNVTQPA